VALFLKCYEGKYANTENLTDPTRRPACMKNAGLDFQAVHACSQNTTAGSLLSRMQTLINATRAPMYAALQPTPGYFPHIFIDGAHQWNNSWTALLSNLCDDAQFAGAPACQALTPVTFTFEVLLTGNTSAIRAHAAAFSASVALGVNYAASQIALPAGFRIKGEPDNAPSYVNIHAVGSASVTSLGGKEVGGWLPVEMALAGVISGNVEAVIMGAKSDAVAEYMAWALSRQENAGAFGNLTAKNIRGQHIVQGGWPTLDVQMKK
jgi:hypothetical protein